MEDGPVRKIATEAARELSQFAPTHMFTHSRRCHDLIPLLQRADPRYSSVPGSARIPVLCRTLSRTEDSILHRRELDHGC